MYDVRCHSKRCQVSGTNFITGRDLEEESFTRETTRCLLLYNNSAHNLTGSVGPLLLQQELPLSLR